ncbi:MAG: LysM peptidoglycan-binding domain-containing protein [Verrucomicrobia bacterium]|jgi:nucleoid-associated protein YgaU|nr:LysM peptidoglycan-binding domain-containing protein [Verrucomicrobiota bacterium]
MKRILIFLVGLGLIVPPVLRAQDAAVEERLNKLNAHVEDLLAAQAEQQKRLAAQAKEIESLREQTAKPTGNFASQEDLRQLAGKLQEIDQKRVTDNEKILKEIEKLGKASAGTRTERKTPKTTTEPVEKPGVASGPEKGFEHVIQSGDTPSTIALAYREKGIKITTEQILKANPGLKPNSLRVGQKIFIPAPVQ